MVFKHKLMKSKWYPNPHSENISFRFGLETAVVNQATIIPICHYDEGLQTASLLETNPENAAFVVDGTSSIYPDSTIENIFIELTMELTKDALEVDKVHHLRFAYMPIFMNFLEDYNPIDELSTNSVEDILEMTHETTDRQGSPLFNNVKMIIGNPNNFLYGTTVPGMDTTQQPEAVAFAPETYYDGLQWYTNAGKLKSAQGGLKWRSLTKNRPVFRTRINLHSTIKRANEYMFGGILIYVPQAGSNLQTLLVGETTNVAHVHCQLKTRYYEWNENFNNAAD